VGVVGALASFVDAPHGTLQVATPLTAASLTQQDSTNAFLLADRKTSQVCYTRGANKTAQGERARAADRAAWLTRENPRVLSGWWSSRTGALP
jgi:hypothetical protein